LVIGNVKKTTKLTVSFVVFFTAPTVNSTVVVSVLFTVGAVEKTTKLTVSFVVFFVPRYTWSKRTELTMLYKLNVAMIPFIYMKFIVM